MIIGMCEKTFAQSRWVGIMPMEFNPSFAGNAGGHRIVSLGAGNTVSTEFSYAKGRILNTSVSYDNFISRLATGVGVIASWYDGNIKSTSYEGKLSALKTGLIVSPKISIKGKYTIAPSVGLYYRHLDLYTNNYDYNTLALMSDFFNLKVGLLFNSEKFYLGYVHNFLPLEVRNPKNTNMGPYYEDDYRGFKTFGIIQTGYKFQKNKESKIASTLQAAIRVGKYTELSDLMNKVNYTVKYKKVLLGVSTASGSRPPPVLSKVSYLKQRLHFDFLAGIGFQTKNIKIFYGQNISNLKYWYNGELSCRIIISNKTKIINQF